MFYNIDCIEGAKQHLADNSVDLIITDPPYGIAGESLHKHYNRNETTVLDGYIDVPMHEYAEFSAQWIAEAARVLKPGGSIYIVSGYTNLIHILNALHKTDLQEVNHIIWKFNFGVYTKKKYVSSHYHILFYQKPGAKPTFNTHARFADMEKDERNGSLNYQDREDVWYIPKAYKPGQVKNKNELPTQLLIKMIQYSSNENDVVCDFFLGSFSTAKIAIGLNRRAVGFEKSNIAFDYQSPLITNVKAGELLETLRNPPQNALFNQGKTLLQSEKNMILEEFAKYKAQGKNKKESITLLTADTGRGYWSLLKIINEQ
jgi:site-specific DNA-methyltransferase (adenine-specific)